MDKNDPRRWTLQKCRLLGGPREENADDKCMELGIPQPLPQRENWDAALLAKKKAAKTRFLQRFPLGRAGSLKGPIR